MTPPPKNSPSTKLSLHMSGVELFVIILGENGNEDCILDKEDMSMVRIYHDEDGLPVAENISDGELIALNGRPLGGPVSLHSGDSLSMLDEEYTIRLEDLTAPGKTGETDDIGADHEPEPDHEPEQEPEPAMKPPPAAIAPDEIKIVTPEISKSVAPIEEPKKPDTPPAVKNESAQGDDTAQNGANLSPEWAKSSSPGLQSYPGFPSKLSPCPVGAASQSVVKLAPPEASEAEVKPDSRRDLRREAKKEEAKKRELDKKHVREAIASASSYSPSDKPAFRIITVLLALILIALAIYYFVTKKSDTPLISESIVEESVEAETEEPPPVIEPAPTPSEPAAVPRIELRETSPELHLDETTEPESVDAANQVWRTDIGSEAGCIALGPDGTSVFAGASDGIIYRLDASDGEILEILDGHTDAVSSISISKERGKMVTGGYDNKAVVWDLATGKKELVLDAHSSPIRSVAINSGATLALTADTEGLIMLWNLRTGEDIRWFIGHTGMVNKVLFAPDGRSFYSAGIDQTIRYWNTDNAEEIYTIDTPESGINALAVTSDGKLLVSGEDGFIPSPDGAVTAGGRLQTLRLWNTENGSQIDRFASCSDWILDLHVMEDNNYLVVATGGDPRNPSITANPPPLVRVWDLRSGLSVKSMKGHIRLINGIEALPGGRDIISTSLDLTVRRWHFR